tara:strand:- start:4 stop:207 length:204 start_codon:yes stop_codon:yes gene_type:complete
MNKQKLFLKLLKLSSEIDDKWDIYDPEIGKPYFDLSIKYDIHRILTAKQIKKLIEKHKKYLQIKPKV